MGIHSQRGSIALATRVREGLRLFNARWVLISLTALAAVCSASWLTALNADRAFRADLLLQTHLVGEMLDYPSILALSGSEADLVRPEYLELKDHLTRTRKAHPHCRFIYLMGRRQDGAIFFYVDSEPTDSVDYSPPGQIYSEAEQAVQEVFTKRKEIALGPHTDRWGTWVSGMIPLSIQSEGHNPVVLGLDIAAEDWIWTVRMRSAIPALLASLALLLGLVAIQLSKSYHNIQAREKQLEESLQTSTDLVQAIPSGLCIFNYIAPDQLILVSGNEAAEKLTGICMSKWIHHEINEIWPHAREAGMTAKYLEVMRTGQTFEVESVQYQEQEKSAFFWIRAFPLPGSRLAVAFEDLTDRLHAEQTLQEAHRRLADIIEFLPDATFVIDQDRKVIAWNRSMEQLTNMPKEEILGKRTYSLCFYPELRPILIDIALDPIERTRVEYPTIEIRGNEVFGEAFVPNVWEGKGAYCWGAASKLFDAEGHVTGAIESIRDITDRKRSEEEHHFLQTQLFQAQKMESVGRLAGGVAHDFNNMLGVILGHIEMAMDQVGPSHSLYEDLLQIQKAAQRSADLTRQLLAFARKQTISPRVLDLNETVSGMLKILQRLIGEDIHLLWKPAAELWPILIDPTQVDQILANLSVNARDAIAGVGNLTIETENVFFDEEYCSAHTGFEPGEYALLAVSDDGSGMDKETQAKIFEPFFTTKEMGKGTGLGLATIYGIVKQNNGFINVYSELGHGTTFKIYLPRHLGEATQSKSKTSAEKISGGHETLLLVEDESAVLIMTKNMLERLGYRVLTASTSDEAIAQAKQHNSLVQMLITDVIMPGMSGRDLAAKLVSLYPNLKTLFMSGYTADSISHHHIMDEHEHFISKPFNMRDLATKVREVLEG